MVSNKIIQKPNFVCLIFVVYSSNAIPEQTCPAGTSTASSRYCQHYKQLVIGEDIPLEGIWRAALSGSLGVSVSSRQTNTKINGQWSFHTHKDLYQGSRTYQGEMKLRVELLCLQAAAYIQVMAQEQWRNEQLTTY